MATNFYRMSTATSIANSGTGSNPLNKPAGIEVASIVPDKKYSVYIATPASFTTDFNSDEAGFAVSMYTKPQPGTVIGAGGYDVVYTGHSFYVENSVGDRLEIAEKSRRVHHVMLTISAMDIGLYVDGEGGSVPSDAPDTYGPVAVTLLSSGGILDDVRALPEIPSSSDIARDVAELFRAYPGVPGTAFMFDDNRDYASREVIRDSVTVHDSVDISLPAQDCEAFKVEYEMIGEGQVYVNDTEAFSGYATDETPLSITIVTSAGCEVRNLAVTYYYTQDALGSGQASIDTELGSGTPAPTHLHDDAAGTSGRTRVSVEGTANNISGWFKAEDGAVLPGVFMLNGKFIDAEANAVSGFHINGKPYTANTEVKDWYFLSKNGAVTGDFEITVPAHALYVSDTALTNDEIDDAYESFIGNPKMTAPTESLNLGEEPPFIIGTEWSIVSSG